MLGLAAASLLGATAPAQAQQLIGYWPFDSVNSFGNAMDVRSGVAAQVRGGAALSGDAEGRSAQPGDKAMVFGLAAQNVHTSDASFANAVSSGNAVTISFWQKLNGIRSSTAFSFVDGSVAGGRGIQAHAPWGDGTIYWDTGGCCDGTMRTSGQPVNPVDWTAWRHLALVKEGDAKYIYVDGVLEITGFNTAPLPGNYSELFIGNAGNLGEAVNGSIDDFAVFSGALTVEQIELLAQGESPLSLATPNDTDADGLPDLWEERYFPGDLTKLGAAPSDADSDGVTDADELARGLNPNAADTDGDGLADGAETGTGTWVGPADTGTNPLVADTDGDGLPDGAETNTNTFVNAGNAGTNPHVTDSDGDGLGDGVEVRYGSSPVSAASTPFAAGVPTLLAWWPFDEGSGSVVTDARAGFVGNLIGAATFSGDGGGHSGETGDYSLIVPGGGSRVDVVTPIFLNLAASRDKFTVSFWQKKYSTPASSVMWAYSTSSGGNRGYQSHVPWLDGSTIYFDTAGCCNAPQRVNGPIPIGTDLFSWHHVVLMKNGPVKEVWVNNQLAFSGSGQAALPADFTALRIGCDNGTASIDGELDDFAIFGSALSAVEIDRLFNGETPEEVASSSDSDADGLPDAWEYIYFPNDLTKFGPSPADFDADGSPDVRELAQDANPTSPDTDSDGLFDGVETGTGTWASPSDRGTDPKAQDSDGDGLLDSAETNTGTFVDAQDTGSNPNLADTDTDTYGDGVEVIYHTNPSLAASKPFTPGETALLAHWPFDGETDPGVTVDSVAQIPAYLQDGAFLSNPGEGRTGGPSDSALTVFGGNQRADVLNGSIMNIASREGAITVTFWQKLFGVQDSSAFWANAASAGGGRGMQGHTPWGNNNIYFDHAGCCNAGVERMDGPVPGEVDLFNWRHWAFIIDGAAKSVWIDGQPVLVGTTSAPLPMDFGVLSIGGGPPGTTPCINGVIDDFALFAGALDQDQLTRLASGESPADLFAAPLVLSSFSYVGGTLSITWPTEAGRNYVVEGSDSLLADDWSFLDDVTGTGADASFSSSSLPAGTYYVRVRRQ